MVRKASTTALYVSAAAVAASGSVPKATAIGAAVPPTHHHQCNLNVRGGASDPSADEEKQQRKRKSRRRRQKKEKRKEEKDGGDDKNRSKSKEKPSKSEASASSQAAEAQPPSPPKPQQQQQKPAASASPPPPSIVDEVLKESDYYKILGTSKQQVKASSPAIIKKAYRRRAVQTHPDKTGGDRRAFDKVAKAYDVLSDASKRQIYDRYGEKGLEHGRGSGGGFANNAEDLFRSFFGRSAAAAGGGGGSGYAPPRRNRTVRYQLEVSLEDIYKGATQSVGISQQPPQQHPFLRMPQQPNDGRRKQVEVVVPRGAQDGESIVLSGEMDFDSSDTPGDVIFVVQQRQHAVFTRRGYDLALVMPISLSEALGGVSRTIRHLDGRSITLKSAASSQGSGVLQSGDVQVLPGEGMPKDAHGHEFGDLYVQYEVSMPEARNYHKLSKAERKELGRLLDKVEGTAAAKQPADEKDARVLQPATVRDFGVKSGRPAPPRQPEEEDEGGGPFGSHRQFFFSSGAGGNPFSAYADDDAPDNGQTQCQQM